MRLKEFFTDKNVLKNLGIAALLTIVLLWFTLFMLSIYTNKGENFPTPNLKGLTVRQVESMTNDRDFRFVIEDSVFRKNFIPGTVVFQNPSAGHKIKPNRLIYITIASFTPEQVEVPKLTDISIRQAKELLESKGFELGDILFHPSEFDDLVLEQSHEGRTLVPGTRLANGSSIDLVVGRKMYGGETIIPDLKMMSLPVAKEILKSRMLTTGSVIYDSAIKTTEDTLSAVIWKQMPPHDSISHVMPGLSVDLWLRINSESPDSTSLKTTNN
jgi:eukaryotic-like serine/threonine-protein kinase